MMQPTAPAQNGSLSVATLPQGPEDSGLIGEALAAVERWSPSLQVAESFPNFLSEAAAGRVDLLVLRDRGAKGETAQLVRRVRQAGYQGAVLALVDETSQPRKLIQAGADATLDQENLDPIFLESIIGVALSLPHRGR